MTIDVLQMYSLGEIMTENMRDIVHLTIFKFIYFHKLSFTILFSGKKKRRQWDKSGAIGKHSYNLRNTAERMQRQLQETNV